MVKISRTTIDSEEKNRSMTSEVHIETMNIESEDSTMLDDSEFEGFSDSESSETANHDRFIINDPLATLLESFNKISSIISGEYREYSIVVGDAGSEDLPVRLALRRQRRGQHHDRGKRSVRRRRSPSTM